VYIYLIYLYLMSYRTLMFIVLRRSLPHLSSGALRTPPPPPPASLLRARGGEAGSSSMRLIALCAAPWVLSWPAKWPLTGLGPRFVPESSRLASPFPFPSFARSYASRPPRRAFAAWPAHANVGVSHASLVRIFVLGRRAGPCPHARRPLRTTSTLPPCGSWAYVMRATCAHATGVARRPLASRHGCGVLATGRCWWPAVNITPSQQTTVLVLPHTRGDTN
jgi:hypothetical protein